VRRGLGYLTLDRQSRTLSGGEVQRINLTTALGTSLVNTLFVLDEPSIGLHPRDLNRIVEAMQRLRDAGNTLVVVEHDPSVMLAADRLIDMGPGPGERGGRSSSTARRGHPQGADADRRLPGRRRRVTDVGLALRPVDAATPRLKLEGAREHNLKDVTVEIPLQAPGLRDRRVGLGQVHAAAGRAVSALARHFGKATESPGAFRAWLGADQVDDVVFVDQSPIGKTARSNPASYVGAFDEIRKLFAKAPLALQRGYTAGTFSFNWRRPLPDLRRLGLRARRDAVPLGRLPALPRLRRHALSRRGAGSQDRARARPGATRAERGRRAGTDGQRGHGPVRERPAVLRVLAPIATWAWNT
jgi:excinuclease ABC subunit A